MPCHRTKLPFESAIIGEDSLHSNAAPPGGLETPEDPRGHTEQPGVTKRGRNHQQTEEPEKPLKPRINRHRQGDVIVEALPLRLFSKSYLFVNQLVEFLLGTGGLLSLLVILLILEDFVGGSAWMCCNREFSARLREA
jgi:hypothetical protein